jgi:hypothetical protein
LANHDVTDHRFDGRPAFAPFYSRAVGFLFPMVDNLNGGLARVWVSAIAAVAERFLGLPSGELDGRSRAAVRKR